MPSDLHESDLYPPDAEDHEVTDEAKEHRKRAAVGGALLVWGMSLLVQRALRVNLDTFLLGIGVGALAGWSQVRRYSWFVVGAICAGIGAADVSETFLGGAFSATVSSLLIALGFAAIYVRYPRRSMWALVPAGIMSLIGAGAFGVGLIGLLPGMLGRFLLPLLLVGGGALLLFRHSLPPKTVKIGLAAVVATFVLVGANTVPDVDHRSLAFDGPPVLSSPPEPPSTPFVIRPGQTLVLDGGGSGDVELRRSPDALGHLSVEDGRRPAAPVGLGRDGVHVTVAERRGDDYIVSLPPGVGVEIERGSGSVKGELAGITGEITTDSGDVDLELHDGGREGIDDDGPLDVETDSGDVRIASDVSLDLDLRSDHGVVLNEVDQDGVFRSPSGTRGIEVEVDSDTGTVDVTTPGDSSPSSSEPTSTAPPEPTAPSD
ncbi:MAG TPA: hypothetical protein VM143_00060 [Acidimicrobiales bacterium]|nr:hypothetical protein [Acidimicrobiales bacterium]